MRTMFDSNAGKCPREQSCIDARDHSIEKPRLFVKLSADALNEKPEQEATEDVQLPRAPSTATEARYSVAKAHAKDERRDHANLLKEVVGRLLDRACRAESELRKVREQLRQERARSKTEQRSREEAGLDSTVMYKDAKLGDKRGR